MTVSRAMISPVCQAVRVKCPPNLRFPEDIAGCGHVFEAEADDEGNADCPKCGLWFIALDNLAAN